MLGLLGLIVGVLTLAVRPTNTQAVDLGASAAGGLRELRSWLAGPPFRIDDQRIDEATGAAVVLLAVTAAGTLFGIAGAFLAVPVTAIVATVLRYLSEQTALRSGEVHGDQVSTVTAEGDRAVWWGKRAGPWFGTRHRGSSKTSGSRGSNTGGSPGR